MKNHIIFDFHKSGLYYKIISTFIYHHSEGDYKDTIKDYILTSGRIAFKTYLL